MAISTGACCTACGSDFYSALAHCDDCEYVTEVKAYLMQLILSIKLFSRFVIQLPLREYQIGPVNAVIQSILMQKGLEFLWVFPRQAGKDEAIGQMLTFLLMLFHRTEASIIHTYPTAQQISVGVQRLENRMANLWMRANLLDELRKSYVMVARSKGLRESKVLYKYPLRTAMNPVASTIGWTLPQLVNGELLTSLVLGLPTVAPLFVGALMSQDMFLAGSIVLILSSLTLIGTLISDIVLAWLDPRIREAV